MTKRRRGIPKNVTLDRKKLRSERQARGWTIEDTVAEANFVFGEATYKRAERGIEISILKGEKIAALFNLRLEELLAGPNAPRFGQKRNLSAASDPTWGRTPNETSNDGDGDAGGERIADRETFLRSQVLIYARTYSEEHGIKFQINSLAISLACREYFREVAKIKTTLLSLDHRLDAFSVGALTCYFLAKHRPVVITDADASSSSDQQLIISYINELMAIAIGCSFPRIVLARDKILTLINILASGIGADSFRLAFLLLKSDMTSDTSL